MGDSWMEFLDDLKDDMVDEFKKELKSLAEDLGDHGFIVIEYGGKLKKYTRRLAQSQISRQDFETRVRDLTRMTEMRLLKEEIQASARAQALVNKTTEFVLNKLLAAAF
jgi:chromosome segregation ATPase